MKSATLLILLTICTTVVTPTFAQAPIVDSDTIFRENSRRPTHPNNDAKIDALIKKMTIEEKVGQMTQLTIDMVTTGDDQEVRIDDAKLKKAIADYGVGS